ncbi:MAG: hypothetical protein GWO24_29495, partial [Akkermansiaceae bacterium]|nr:hypothetical protein [Akkermansiaceae bacterium]
MKTRQLTVEAAEAGALLDFLARRLDLSRRKAKELLDSRSVLVNDRRVWMARHEVRRDDRVTVPSARHQLPVFGP